MLSVRHERASRITSRAADVCTNPIDARVESNDKRRSESTQTSFGKAAGFSADEVPPKRCRHAAVAVKSISNRLRASAPRPPPSGWKTKRLKKKNNTKTSRIRRRRQMAFRDGRTANSLAAVRKALRLEVLAWLRRAHAENEHTALHRVKPFSHGYVFEKHGKLRLSVGVVNTGTRNRPGGMATDNGGDR